jgi:hypothetical protein
MAHIWHVFREMWGAAVGRPFLLAADVCHQKQNIVQLKVGAACALLSPVVLLVHGYHPLADDGAIYVAGVKKLLNPNLFPTGSVFVLAPTHLSVFAPVLAAIVGWSHLPLPQVLLACQLLSIFLFLVGCYQVAGWSAALLGACLFTLPIAGTSLSLMDPYVTARSFSTPFTLFALAAVLKERWSWAALWIALAALIHPLMAAYALLSLTTVALTQRRMWRSLATLAALGWLLCTVVFLLTRHEPSPAALSRSYFFLSSWQWFEYFGLVMPLLLLALLRRPLSTAATLCGIFALLVSICFVHRSGSLMLARVQPLRTFHFVYLAGLLVAGDFLKRLPKRAITLVAAVLLVIVFTAQRLTYSSSHHVEWPWLAPHNEWQQAFLWIRTNTPQDAIFALDNDYIESPGEDAQGFRAIAERSAVPDYFKDGGIASNFPQAAGLWLQGSQATAHLNQATDAQRLKRLAPLGATWIVLPARSATALPCPYVNPEVRVCKLGPF